MRSRKKTFVGDRARFGRQGCQGEQKDGLRAPSEGLHDVSTSPTHGCPLTRRVAPPVVVHVVLLRNKWFLLVVHAEGVVGRILEHRGPADGVHRRVGLAHSLPGVTGLVTWNTPAGIHRCCCPYAHTRDVGRAVTRRGVRWVTRTTLGVWHINWLRNDVKRRSNPPAVS
jgi:hypothetical protein